MSETATRDENYIPTLLGVSSSDPTQVLAVRVDPVTQRMLVDLSGASGLTDTDDLTEGTSNLYYTDERVDDRVNALISVGFGLTKTYNDAGNSYSLATETAPQTLTVTTNAVTPDATYQNHYATHDANITVNNPTNAGDGKLLFIGIKNSSAGVITVTGGNKFRFGTDITALSSIAAGKINYYGLRYHATDDKWDVISEIRGF